VGVGRRGVPPGGGLGVILLAAVLGSLALCGDAGSRPTSRPAVLAAPVDRCGPGWVATWRTSPQAMPATERLAGRTLRMIVHSQVTGTEVRVRLSNRYGTGPLVVGSASAARGGPGATLEPGTVQPLTFGGRAGAVVDPGAELVSDPVPLVAEAGRPIAVSLVPESAPDVVAGHPVALQTSYLSVPGDFALDGAGTAFTTPIASWLVLTGVDVLTPRAVNALVAMGDSITDGVGSGTDTDSRWSDALADRLVHRGGTATMAVLNAGISRNELLADRGREGGASPLDRLGREVVDVPGATDVVLHIGTNDIAAGRSEEEIVGGLTRFAGLAHAAGRRVFLATITPSDAGPHGTAQATAVRDRVNRWVRERGAEYADGVVDFAAAVADPVRPDRLRHRYDSGDGLHLSAAGYRALADAVDVTRLTGSPCLADQSRTRVVLSDD
jgi:lysophospholipase L1-like esterase